MLTHLVSIGNSKGVRIPAALLRQYNISDNVELIPDRDSIILRPVARKTREGWDAAFAQMHQRGDDMPLLEDTIDLEEWEWS